MGPGATVIIWLVDAAGEVCPVSSEQYELMNTAVAEQYTPKFSVNEAYALAEQRRAVATKRGPRN